MFSLIRFAAAGTIFLMMAAAIALNLGSTTDQTEKALRTRQLMAAMLEQASAGNAAPGTVLTGTDAWGGTFYLLPFCTAENQSSYPASERNYVAYLGVSGGSALQLSQTLRGALFDTAGAYKASAYAHTCRSKSNVLTGGMPSLPAAATLPDFIEPFSYQDMLNHSGNSAAGTTVRNGGSAYYTSLWRQDSGSTSNPRLAGASDGELRFFAGEKALFYWNMSGQRWQPIQSDPNSVKGRCPGGWVYMPTTEYANATVEPAFCVTAGEVLYASTDGKAYDPATAYDMAGGLATPQPYAPREVKLAGGSGSELVHATPSLVTYNQARAICATMGPSGTLFQGSQLEAFKVQTGQAAFDGYLPQPENLVGRPGTPCKGTENGLNVCAVDWLAPTGAVSFYGTAEQRTQVVTLGGVQQVMWDLGGNLAEWIQSGPEALSSSEPASLLGKGYFEEDAGSGPLSARVLNATGLTSARPTSRAGFRCSFRLP